MDRRVREGPVGDGRPVGPDRQARLVAEGVLGRTHCTDDGVGLVYRGTELVEAVTEVRGKGAWVVQRGDDGHVTEERLEPRVLPGAR